VGNFFEGKDVYNHWVTEFHKIPGHDIKFGWLPDTDGVVEAICPGDELVLLRFHSLFFLVLQRVQEGSSTFRRIGMSRAENLFNETGPAGVFRREITIV